MLGLGQRELTHIGKKWPFRLRSTSVNRSHIVLDLFQARRYLSYCKERRYKVCNVRGELGAEQSFYRSRSPRSLQYIFTGDIEFVHPRQFKRALT